MKNSRTFNTLAYTFLTLVVTFMLIQVALLFIMAGKTQSQLGVSPMLPTFPYHWENFEQAWNLGVRDYMVNSVIIAFAVVIGDTALACLTAYVFARYDFPGKNLLFSGILALMMIPGVLTLVPRFVLIRDLRLLNTLWAVIIPSVLGANAFQIVIFRTFFGGLAEELFEAARMDGAGHWTLFARITIPLSMPIISSMAILRFHGIWNEWLWPLLVLSRDELRPVSVGLLMLSTERQPEIGVQMAGSVMASIPLIIIFIFAMRSFIEGLAAGAIKL
jgi:ABC-type glycerol-3-phosphate transport system permease component